MDTTFFVAEVFPALGREISRRRFGTDLAKGIRFVYRWAGKTLVLIETRATACSLHSYVFVPPLTKKGVLDSVDIFIHN